jgi:hypothetical protein
MSQSFDASQDKADSTSLTSPPQGTTIVGDVEDSFSDFPPPGFIRNTSPVPGTANVPNSRNNNQTSGQASLFDDLEDMSDHSNNHSDVQSVREANAASNTNNSRRPVPVYREANDIWYLGANTNGNSLYFLMGSAASLPPLDVSPGAPFDGSLEAPFNAAFKFSDEKQIGPGGIGFWRKERNQERLKLTPFDKIRLFKDEHSIYGWVFDCIEEAEPDEFTIPVNVNRASATRNHATLETINFSDYVRSQNNQRAQAQPNPASSNALGTRNGDSKPAAAPPTSAFNVAPPQSRTTGSPSTTADTATNTNTSANPAATRVPPGVKVPPQANQASTGSTNPAQPSLAPAPGIRISGNPFAAAPSAPTFTNPTVDYGLGTANVIPDTFAANPQPAAPPNPFNSSNGPSAHQSIRFVPPPKVDKDIQLRAYNLCAVYNFCLLVLNYDMLAEDQEYYPVAKAIKAHVLRAAFAGSPYDIREIKKWDTPTILRFLKSRVEPKTPEEMTSVWASNQILSFKRASDYKVNHISNRQQYLSDIQIFLDEALNLFYWLIEGKTSGQIADIMPALYSTSEFSLVRCVLDKIDEAQGVGPYNYLRRVWTKRSNKPYFRNALKPLVPLETAFPSILTTLKDLLNKGIDAMHLILAEELKMNPKLTGALESLTVDPEYNASASSAFTQEATRNAKHNALKKEVQLQNLTEQLDFLAVQEQSGKEDEQSNAEDLNDVPIYRNPEYAPFEHVLTHAINIMNGPPAEKRVHEKALQSALRPFNRFVQDVKKQDPTSPQTSHLKNTPMVCFRAIYNDGVCGTKNCKYAHGWPAIFDFLNAVKKEHERVTTMQKNDKHKPQVLQVLEEERDPPSLPSALYDVDTDEDEYVDEDEDPDLI